jgi:MFS family permease
MRPRQLAGLILASTLVTLEGTGTTIALANIGKDLSASVYRLQWISNAPLVILAALLLPAGALADRFGRTRVARVGLTVFAGGTIASAIAPSDLALIGARCVVGAGGALILPAVLALLGAAYADAAERTRIFGIWAAWTGVSAAAGPLLAGVLVDLFSWRAVFVPAAAGAFTALALVDRKMKGGAPTRRHPVPLATTAILIVFFGATAWLVMSLGNAGLAWTASALPGGLALASMVPLAQDSRRHLLFPRELVRARNCLPANAATFGLYFGMFGSSFLLALYTQQVLGYAALRAALVLLPMSLMLLFAEAFGRLAARAGTRTLIATGVLAASAGIAWIAAGPHPLAFWSRMIVGTAVFGLGTSLAISALTHAAVAAVPPACAGAASGLNHAVVRAAGLVAIAVLGAVAAPGMSAAISAGGFSRAMAIAAAVVGVAGLGGAAMLRNEEPGGLTSSAEDNTRGAPEAA